MTRTSRLSLPRLSIAPHPYGNLELAVAVLLTLIFAGLAANVLLQWASATASFSPIDPIGFETSER